MCGYICLKKELHKRSFFGIKINDPITDESTEILTLPATHDTVHILHKKLQKFNFQQNKNTQLHRTPTGQSHHDLLQNT